MARSGLNGGFVAQSGTNPTVQAGLGESPADWRLGLGMNDEAASRDRSLARLAAVQHGVVSSAQLADVGLDRSATMRRARAGRLHLIHRGVYAVGHAGIGFEGRLMAAVLACGPGSVLSHRSAAELWGMLPEARGPVHVTVPTHAGREKRHGLIVHRSVTLGSAAIAEREGIPLTSPRRTLEDLHRRLDAEQHRRALRRAVDLGLLEVASWRREALTRSELERRFLALCRRRRLPRPEVNARIGGYEVDFLWPERMLIVETDGFEFHRSREAFERDRERDAVLQARGYRVLRLTARQVEHDPAAVVRSLRALLIA